MKRTLGVFLPFLVFGVVAPGNIHSQDLQEAVRKRLASMSEFGAFDWITFRVEGANVRLMGFASRPSLKKSAEKAVYKVTGVELVENEIEVLPTSGSDDNLRLRAYNAIYTHSALQRYAPRVEESIRTATGGMWRARATGESTLRCIRAGRTPCTSSSRTATSLCMAT